MFNIEKELEKNLMSDETFFLLQKGTSCTRQYQGGSREKATS